MTIGTVGWFTKNIRTTQNSATLWNFRGAARRPISYRGEGERLGTKSQLGHKRNQQIAWGENYRRSHLLVCDDMSVFLLSTYWMIRTNNLNSNKSYKLQQVNNYRVRCISSVVLAVMSLFFVYQNLQKMSAFPKVVDISNRKPGEEINWRLLRTVCTFPLLSIQNPFHLCRKSHWFCITMLYATRLA